jgi:hypothetical protein
LFSAILGYLVFQLVSPDGRLLEGHAVIPHMPVALNRGQLLKAVDSQLQAAIRYFGESAQ